MKKEVCSDLIMCTELMTDNGIGKDEICKRTGLALDVVEKLLVLCKVDPYDDDAYMEAMDNSGLTFYCPDTTSCINGLCEWEHNSKTYKVDIK